ncbi:hypothetical protein BS113_16675 [Vibrio cholerae]|nr:hypothetical protein BS113_16675 [Vibrio cholerae]
MYLRCFNESYIVIFMSFTVLLFPVDLMGFAVCITYGALMFSRVAERDIVSRCALVQKAGS